MPSSILIVDPTRQTRDFTVSMLHSLGHRYVWAAEDLARTRAFLAAVVFDYVVLDPQLPGMPINALLRSIHASTPHTTIAVLSHLPNAASRFPEADCVLTKPLSFAELNRLLERKRASVLH